MTNDRQPANADAVNAVTDSDPPDKKEGLQESLAENSLEAKATSSITREHSGNGMPCPDH
jgi:hypothetical protein